MTDHEVNVTLHSENEIEIKVYSCSSTLSKGRLRLDITMQTPHCLGVYSRESFMDDVRIRTRVGINCGWSLSKIMDEYCEFEDALLSSGRQVEEMVCLMGCTLKSSIRRSIRDGSCSVVDMRKLLDAVSDLRARVCNEVVDRLEEFMLMAVHITTSRVALRDKGQEGACQLALYAQERLAMFKNGALYSYRWHYLKHYFYNKLEMVPTITQPTWFWTDVLGSAAAGIAMTVAVVIAWFSQRFFNDSVYVLSVALIFGYMIKDRIKEWVKRKGMTFFKLPNRMQSLSLLSTDVAKVDEWYTVLETDEYLNKFSIKREIQMHHPSFLDTMTGTARWHKHKHDDKYDIVQVVRINMANFRERIPSNHDSYVYIDHDTRTPSILECINQYNVFFKLSIQHLEPDRFTFMPRYSVYAVKKEAITVYEHECSAMLDSTGIHSLR